MKIENWISGFFFILIPVVCAIGKAEDKVLVDEFSLGSQDAPDASALPWAEYKNLLSNPSDPYLEKWWLNSALKEFASCSDITATCSGANVDFLPVKKGGDNGATEEINDHDHVFKNDYSRFVAPGTTGSIRYDVSSLSGKKELKLRIYGTSLFGVMKKTGWDGGKWKYFCKYEVANSQFKSAGHYSWLEGYKAADPDADIKELALMPYYTAPSGDKPCVIKDPDGYFNQIGDPSDPLNGFARMERISVLPPGYSPVFRFQESSDGKNWKDIEWKYNAVANSVGEGVPDNWQAAEITSISSSSAKKMKITINAPKTVWGADSLEINGVWLAGTKIRSSK